MAREQMFLGIGIIVLAVVLAVSGGMSRQPDARAESMDHQETTTTDTLSVSAEGSIAAAPDIARLEVGVETTGDTAQRAIALNSKKMGDVIDRLKAMGIEDEDMQTSRFSVSPQYERSNRDSERVLVGFRARNRVSVGIRDVEQVGKLIDSAVAAGANQIHNIDFDISDRSEYEEEAMKLAVQRAKQKAEIVADESGVDIVGIKEINVEEARTPAPRLDVALETYADTPIVSGEVTVNMRVSVVFKISN